MSILPPLPNMLNPEDNAGSVLPPLPAPVSTQRQADLVAASESRRAELGGQSSDDNDDEMAQTFRNAAIIRRTGGAGVNSASELERNLALLSFDEIRQRYGEREGNALIQGVLRADSEYGQQISGYRTPSERTYDLASSVALGGANVVLGIGALGLGLANERAGLWAAQQLDSLNQAVQGTQSRSLQDRRLASASRSELNQRDSTRLFEQQREAGTSNFMAGLRRFGRDVVDAVAEGSSDSTVLSDGIAQGVGSLLAVGPVARGINAVGRAATLGAASRVPGSVPLAIGAMEAGGSYQETANEVLGMSEEQLQAGSEHYRTLRQRMGHEAARRQVANETALLAAGITAPAAVAAGTLVSRFEGAPFRVGSLRGAAGNITRETAEEGLQSAGGASAQNFAIQSLADSERTLSEGVGEQAGLGALYGAGTAGVVQSPGVAARGAIAAVRGTGRLTMFALGGVTEGLNRRAEALRERNEAATPVSDANIEAAVTEAAVQAPAAETSLRTAIAESGATPEAQAQANALVDRILGFAATTDMPDMPPELEPIVSGSKNRMNAIIRLATALQELEDNSPQAQQIAAKLYEFEQAVLELQEADPEALANLPADNVGRQIFDRLTGLMVRMNQNKKIGAAIAKARKIIETNAETLTAQNAQENVAFAMAVASLVPEKAKLEVNNEILNMAERGDIDLSPSDKAILETSNAILQADAEAKSEQQKRGHKKTMQSVAAQVLTSQDDRGKKFSAIQHTQKIFQALRAGNIPLAQDRARELRNFIKNMQNKVAAWNESFRTGEEVLYQAYNPDKGVWYTSLTGIRAMPTSARGVEFGQQLEMEAQRLIKIYNTLAVAFPELSKEDIANVALVSGMQGQVDEVAEAFRTGARKRPDSVGSNPQTTATTESKPVPKSTTPKPPAPKPAATPGAVPKSNFPKPPVLAEAVIETPSKKEEKKEVSSEKEGDIFSSENKIEEVAATDETGSPPAAGDTATGAAATPPKTTRERFPTLSKFSRFVTAFRLPKKEKSRIANSAEPVQEALRLLAERIPPDAFEEFDLLMSRYQDIYEALNERLQAFLDKADKTTDKTNLERLLAGEPVNEWVNGKAINLAEPDENGLRYNNQLIEMALVATYQWLLTDGQFDAKLDERAVAGLLGMKEEDVTDDLMSQLEDQGQTTLSAVNSLTRKIEKYWGLSRNDEEVDGFVKGIPEAIAKEILEILVETNQLRKMKTRISLPDGSPREVDFYQVMLNPLDPKTDKPAMFDPEHPLRRYADAIEKVVAVESDEVFYYENERPTVSDKQLRNPHVKNTKEDMEMIENAQETPHFLDQVMSSFYVNFTLDNLIEVLGAGKVSESGKPFNYIDKKRREGINTGIRNAYNTLLTMMGQISERQSVRDNELTPGQVPIHYKYEITRVGRLQMIGRYVPQTSKLIREAILPTWSKLDLNNQLGDGYLFFTVALAQALGVKVHTLPDKNSKDRSFTQAELFKRLEEKHKDSVEILRAYHRTGDLDGAKLAEVLKREFKGPATAAALHALVEYARYEEASKKERGAFRTSLYVEADGVTNGPVNATVLLAYGDFNEDWVDRVAKGGLHFRGHSEGPKTNNEFRTSKSNKDLYSTTTDLLQKYLTELRDNIQNPKVREQFSHVQELLTLFMPDYEVIYDDQGRLSGFEIDRGVAKNPLTITIYGSGERGIAGNILDAMLEEITIRMTQAAQKRLAEPDMPMAEAFFVDDKTTPQQARDKWIRFQRAFEPLTRFMTTKSEEKGLNTFPPFKRNAKGEPVRGSDGRIVYLVPEKLFWENPEGFDLPKLRRSNLLTNIHQLFVVPLRQAITDTVTQSVIDGAKLLQEATQAQSQLQVETFKELVNQILVENVTKNARIKAFKLSPEQIEVAVRTTERMTKEDQEAFLMEHKLTLDQLRAIQAARGQGLTQKEQDWIMGEVLKKFPVIMAGTQVFFPGGTQNSELSNTAYSRSFTGGFSTPAALAGPKNAGVSGIPFMIIGTGDGKAIQSLARGFGNKANAPQGALYIFDGVHFKLETMREDAVKANQAIFESWKENPLRAVQQAIQASLPNIKGGDRERMAAINEELLAAATSVEARHRVQQKVSHHIDQMASLMLPYYNKGIELAGTTNAEIADALNKLYKIELLKVAKEWGVSEELLIKNKIMQPTPGSAPANPDAVLSTITKKNVRAVITGGLKFADKDSLFAALDQLKASHGISTLIHQDARGADSLASEWAKANEVAEIIIQPDWATYGRNAAAWEDANQRALTDHAPDLTIAFGGDTGTADMVARTRAASVPVWEPGTRKRKASTPPPAATGSTPPPPAGSKGGFTPKNEEQRLGIEMIQNFLEDPSPKEQIFVLEGKAGTGKTTIMQEALRKVLIAGKAVTVAAVSHKAKGVLEKKLRTFVKNNAPKGRVEAYSIAGLLGMLPHKENGKEVFLIDQNRLDEAPINDAEVLVIDEASMIDQKTLTVILDNVRISTKIIFLGDIGQLAPVEGNGEISPVFTMNALRHKLTERVRQGEDSTILPYADNYWNNSQSSKAALNPISPSDRVNSSEMKFYRSVEEMLIDYIDLFRRAVKEKISDLVKIVAYNNKEGKAKGAAELRELEARIRREIFGPEAQAFEEGELVIMNNSFLQSKIVIAENSEEFSVQSSTPDSIFVRGKEFPIFKLIVKRGNSPVLVNLPVLDPDPAVRDDWFKTMQEWRSEIKAKGRKEAWKEYNRVEESLANVSYAYVITSHKAQGSTYGTSIVLEDNFLRNSSVIEKENLSRGIYTAITRASQEAVIVSAKNPDQSAPNQFGEKHPTGVKVHSISSMKNLLAQVNLSPLARAVFNRISITKSVEGYRIVQGTPAQMQAFAEAENLPIPVFEENGFVNKGVIHPGPRVIYLQTNRLEPLIHELLHAATFDTLRQFYARPGSVGQETFHAIKRLEKLMDQFLALDVSEMSKDTRKAWENAVATINRHKTAGNMPAAITEYIAWGLANQDLARLQASTKATLKDQVVLLAQKTINAIKNFLFGTTDISQTNDDMLSNLLFNSKIVMEEVPTIQEQFSGTLNMAVNYGTDERLLKIEEGFQRHIVNYINRDPVDLGVNYNVVAQIGRQNKANTAIMYASALVNSAMTQGQFSMTPQAQGTFKAVVAALATQASIDANSMSEAQKLYTHVLKNLKFTDLLTDPLTTDQNELQRGQDMLNFLEGAFLRRTDLQGRSSLVPVFLGLAMVNDDLRRAISKMPMPKGEYAKTNSLDAVLENLGTSQMERLSRTMAGTNKSKDVQQALDALTLKVADLAQERQTILDQYASKAGGIVDRGNELMIQGVTTLAAKAVSATQGLEAANPNRFTKLLREATEIGEAIVNESKAEVVAQGIMKTMNKIEGWKPFTTLVNDLVGRTLSNMGVYDLIKLTRSDSQQDRQHYREDLPPIIAKQFQTRPTDAQWTSMFKGMGKTDMAAVVETGRVSQALDYLTDPQKLDREITRLENTLEQADQPHWALVQRKSEQLANHMNTGKTGTNLLRNAEAVSRLLGETTRRDRPTPNEAYIENVDRLISLYALKNLPQDDKDTLASLVQNDRNGVVFVLSYLVGQRSDEIQKTQIGPARLNHYKGHIPSLQKEGVSLIIADDVADGPRMKELSYVRVGDYNGSAADNTRGSWGYYYAPISKLSPYAQGIVQTAQQTASGVEALSGFTVDMTGGRITDPREVYRLSRRIRYETGDTENLMPVYDEEGVLRAYERAVDPTQLARMQKDTHLARMIGVWRGRQVEEYKAQIYNRRLVDALHEMYVEDMRNPANKAQYINMFDKNELNKDPVLKDAFALVPKETLNYIKSKFGRKEFYVRRDMLTDTFGYRKASIGDAWTGNTRWDPRVQRFVKNLAVSVWGDKAYGILVSREQDLQSVVTAARQLIVVKSVIVPVANFMSNIYHLIARGVPMATIARTLPKKLDEINRYTKDRIRKVQLEADLRAADGDNDVLRARKLRNEIQTIEDNWRRLSIWPLIQAGEFTAISDAGISREDLALTEGRLAEFIERAIDKLPGPAQTAGRYAFITKDTALFEALQKAVQYGDFLGKAILYDDLTQRQKKSRDYALGRVTEEFVNYDRLPGRFRAGLEDNGLLWFYHFKIRAAKIALSIIRNNPVHALLMSMLPAPDIKVQIGTVLGDNVAAKIVDGTLPYSVGPGMGFRAPELNPWWALMK